MNRLQKTCIFSMLLVSPMVQAQESATRIPAKFLFSFGNLGSSLELAQPTRIRYDRPHQEFYVVDTGHHRIVLLNSEGNYIFEFSALDVMSAPSDVAVDSEGRIYVLCTPKEGNAVQVFDYNGDYLHPFAFRNGPDPATFEISSLVLDASDQLLLLDGKGPRILFYEASGNFNHEFPILSDLEEKLRPDQLFPSLYLEGDFIYIPAPMLGTVYCYDKKGQLSKTIGHTGGGYGELSFPVAVATDTDGEVWVLDKHRHTLIGFDSGGRILGEYGGLGTTPGWFYHPISMLVDERHRAWVVQGLGNLVQVLQLPAFTARLTTDQKEPNAVVN